MEENMDFIPEQPSGDEIVPVECPQEAVPELEPIENAVPEGTEAACEPPVIDMTLEGEAQAEPKKSKRIFFAVFGGVVGLCLLLLVGLMFLGDGGIDIVKHLCSERTVFVREDDGSSGLLTPEEAADTVKKSTVTVRVRVNGVTGIGSGFVYDDKGHICTNYHVIDSASSVQVILDDGTVRDASVVGYDEDADLAVLKVDPAGLVPATLGSSADLLPGDGVVAVGTPVDLSLSGTATFGKVSYTNRLLPVTDTQGNVTARLTVIQTDVSVNHGNSGGPLADMYGHVVGIVARKMESSVYTYEGLGFAIPIDGAKVILDAIIKDGSFTGENPVAHGRLQLGLTGHSVLGGKWYLANAQTGSYMALDEAVSGAYYAERDGVYVIEVTGANPKGKVIAGDIVLRVDGLQIYSTQELIACVNGHHAGDKVVLTLLREGNEVEVEIRLVEAPLH